MAFLLLICSSAYAQGPSIRSSKSKLSKNDRIWQAAYDDTTRALAYLFIYMRAEIMGKHKADLPVGGVSAVALTAGVLLMTHDSDVTGAAASYDNADGADLLGIILFMGGSAGVLYSGIGQLINALELSPYTLKRYYKVLDLYNRGKPVPEFYRKRLAMIPH